MALGADEYWPHMNDVHSQAFLDRLERTDGQCRIVLRRCPIEWAFNARAALVTSGALAGFIKVTWNWDDPSYARVLEMDTPADRW